MDDPSISVLIPNRFSFDGIILTIESIRKRTRGDIKIIVADNSLAPNAKSRERPWTVPEGQDDGNRRTYLRDLADAGAITLINNLSQRSGRYGHGENIRIMLEAVKTPYAMLFNSSSEILRGDWLDVLTAQIVDRNHDLGAADHRGGWAREYDYIMPVYWPNMMMLNVPLLRRFYPENNWDLDVIGFENFRRPELFKGMQPTQPERNPPWVFCDTGWRLWDKLTYNNPGGVRMLPIPAEFYGEPDPCIHWMGGIDRCAHTLFLSTGSEYNRAHVRSALDEIARRLDRLRAE